MNGICRGADNYYHYEQSLLSYVQDQIRELREKTSHVSRSRFIYLPTYTDNLQVVKVAGKAVLREASKLTYLKANSFGLYNCFLNGSATGEIGNVRVVNTTISGDLSSQGEKIVIKNSTIKCVHILPRKGRQVVEISNSTIENLELTALQFTLKLTSLNESLNYISRDGMLTLKLKNVKINNITTSN